MFHSRSLNQLLRNRCQWVHLRFLASEILINASEDPQAASDSRRLGEASIDSFTAWKGPTVRHKGLQARWKSTLCKPLRRVLYGGQPLSQRVLDEIGDIVQVELLHDMPAMRGDGLDTDIELSGDLLGTIPFGDQL